MIQVLQHHHHSFSVSHLMPSYGNKENEDRLENHSVIKNVPSQNPEQSKQKSQLCRRFMECGFCPYQKRCKFAHGCHELLRNNQANIKYKTKQCQNFSKHNFCIYGMRCNFIHSHQGLPLRKPNSRDDIELRLAEKVSLQSSRLLRLIQ